MARKKSPIGSILSASIFAAAAASVGYLAYRGFTSKTAKKSTKKKPRAKRPGGSISRRKDTKVSKDSSPAEKSRTSDGPTVRWIPNLRVREQKILNLMPSGGEITMPEIQAKFKDVTVRTLRRDMDNLVEKGRVTKSGSTRATTYRKV